MPPASAVPGRRHVCHHCDVIPVEVWLPIESGASRLTRLREQSVGIDITVMTG